MLTSAYTLATTTTSMHTFIMKFVDVLWDVSTRRLNPMVFVTSVALRAYIAPIDAIVNQSAPGRSVVIPASMMIHT